MLRCYAIILVIILFTSCSYKVPFGAEPVTGNFQKNSDVDSVLDQQVTTPNGYGMTQKGFHWGW
jgi:hypothetical protein